MWHRLQIYVELMHFHPGPLGPSGILGLKFTYVHLNFSALLILKTKSHYSLSRTKILTMRG